ncbi:MAG: NAD(P)/FAD-dependent oxidoreductase [Bdellovibrionales bacterium]
MRSITVVGAGFSGLSLAYHLRKEGFGVSVVEKQSRVGGLISTERTEWGLVESAATSLLADQSVENLFNDLGIEFAERKPERRKRYVYWERPRRWPLSAGSSVRLAAQMARLALGDPKVFPGAGESVKAWAVRVVNSEFEARLLAPMLQGIYAGETGRMSASLSLSSLLGERLPKGRHKGSVAPTGGMGELMHALYKRLRADGVEFQLKSSFTMPEYLTQPHVLCTSAWHAADLLNVTHPQIAAQLRNCESVPLIGVTCFFRSSGAELDGFGCLFPEAQGFSALGVLFPSCIFEGRSELRSEMWILGGARKGGDLLALSDEQLLEAIRHDRQRLLPRSTLPPVGWKIIRWPRAIPYYTLEWERVLKSMDVPPPLFLHGNYLGQIGLARIHHRSRELALKLKDMYG